MTRVIDSIRGLALKLHDENRSMRLTPKEISFGVNWHLWVNFVIAQPLSLILALGKHNWVLLEHSRRLNGLENASFHYESSVWAHPFVSLGTLLCLRDWLFQFPHHALVRAAQKSIFYLLIPFPITELWWSWSYSWWNSYFSNPVYNAYWDWSSLQTHTCA